MKRPLVLTFFSFLCFCLLGFFVKGHETVLQRELADLSNWGLVIEEMSDTWLEVRDSLTGEEHRFPLQPILEPRELRYKGLPTLTIDLTTIDTSLFSWKYHYHSTIPVSGNRGFPLQSGDLDHNLQTEVYGLYADSSGYGTKICEINENNEWETTYTYTVRIGVVDNIADVDLNGLKEVYGSNGDTVYVFEQGSINGLPTVNKFRFRKYYFSAFGIPIKLADMNGDGRLELAYRGSEPDTFYTNIAKTYVAKYDTTINNFMPVWGEQLPPGCMDIYCTLNLSTGEFDDDGEKDIVTSAFDGNIYVIEYADNDSFSVVWSDSIAVAGRVASGDVDGNGSEEFFVGGNQVEMDGYVHMRILAYGSIGDNQYEPFFAFDIYPVGYFFVDLYQTVDIDNDGQKELLISFGGGNIIVKGTGEHQYELFYYAPVASSDGFSAGDVNGDNIPELFVGQYLGGEPIVRQTRVFSLDATLVGVDRPTLEVGSSGITLSQNYPNPFNPSTTFTFQVERPTWVKVDIFDLNGRIIATPFNENKPAGRYEVSWSGTDQTGRRVSTGVYFVRIQSPEISLIKKLLFIR